MGSPRAVRIPRSPRADRGGIGGVERRENTAGRRRAVRLFGLFAVGLAALYLAFVALSAAAVGGLGGAPAGLALFTLLAALFLVWAWSITLRRAPRAVRFTPTSIVVQESAHRTRVYPIGPALERHVIERYPASPLGPLPTELVRVGDAGGVQRLYLVGRGLFNAPMNPIEP